MQNGLLHDKLMRGCSIYEHNSQAFFGDMRAIGWKIHLGTDTLLFSVLIYVQCEFP
jgi:hypothetical protein